MQSLEPPRMSGVGVHISSEHADARGFSQSDVALMGRFLEKPGFLLARVDQICTAIFSSLSDSVTLSQAEFLLLLDRLGPMIQIALARAAGVDKSTTAYILDNLQARGWIKRTVDEDDRRTLLISLTPAGQALLPRVRRDFTGLQRELEAPLDPTDRKFLIGYLYQLGQNEDVPGPSWRVACEPDSGVLDLAPSFLARRALQLFHAQFMAMTHGMRLTMRQFSLLYILSQRGSITQTEFARVFGLDPATCAVIMRGPASRGLIASAPCEHDRRARIYTLTSAGLAMLGEVHPLIDRAEAAVFNCESLEVREKIVCQLRQIVSAHSHRLRFPGVITGA